MPQGHARIVGSLSTIHFPSVSHGEYGHHVISVVDGVQDSVVPGAKPEFLFSTPEFSDAFGAGVVSQGLNSSADAAMYGRR